MQHTAVNPPRAAAFVPVSIVSESSWPGSRKWQCKSINPGATISPFASNISAPSAEIFDPTLEMRSPSSSTSSDASVLLAGSMTRPFLISSILSFLRGGMRRIDRYDADQVIQQSHSYRQTVRHLVEHA